METTELQKQAGALLGRLSAEIMKRSSGDMLRLMQREELSMPRMVTLMFIARHGCASVSAICEYLGLKLGTTSQIVDQLVMAGFVMRHENPEDRRLKHITLSERGRALIQEIEQIRGAQLTQQLAHVPEPLLRDLLVVMGKVMDALEYQEKE